MTKLSLAGAFAVVVLAAACERPDQSAADTAAAASAIEATKSAPQTDTLSKTTIASTSTVARASAGKKSTGSAARKATKPIRAADSAYGDSILGRDSVIRLPIRRLPTVKH
jgi:hypothetical protein